MIHSVTIGYPHDTKAKPKVIAGPDVPYPKQLQDLKASTAKRSNKDFARVELWTSGHGLTKAAKFITPEEEKRREKVLSEQVESAAKDKGSA